MKKIFLLSAMAVLMLSSTIVLDSCKKGADDPAISLRSRKARLAGEWTISKSSDVSVSTSAGTSTTTTKTVEGTTESTTSGGVTTTNSITDKLTIDKAGTYTRVITRTSGSFSLTISSAGNWNFVSGGGDLKNKEAIIVVESSSSTSSSSGGVITTVASTSNPNTTGTVWTITRLANKELVVSMNDTNTSGTTTTVDTRSMTFIQ